MLSKSFENDTTNTQQWSQHGARSIQQLKKKGRKKKRKNERQENQLKAKKTPVTDHQHHHSETTGKDKGRGKPFPREGGVAAMLENGPDATLNHLTPKAGGIIYTSRVAGRGPYAES